MCKVLDERELEVLKASLDSQRFYHVYKKTPLPLASAWRLIRRLAKAGLIEYNRGHIKVAEAGLIVLANHGDPIALALLAHKYRVNTVAVKEFLEFLCQRIKDMPVKTLVDTVGLIGPGSLKELHGTPAEGLAAKLLLEFCKEFVVEVDGSKFLLGGKGIIVAYCKLCDREGRLELYPNCPLAKLFFRSLKTRFLKVNKTFSDADKKT
ncbi:hypothetical protein Pogu_0913 [Pyrobaculum oguniense TE7]|uniref:Uncharacterized protein n=1 Tax=Pyrobaculum oguniense (strain DSM 13380 / JCM 10595 / TE7) TaxID=698757 RepID=H6Q8D3_PYROT|nr:hypothetical protein Pogu_0913 [Pyrobaculum oguniense TE7]